MPFRDAYRALRGILLRALNAPQSVKPTVRAPEDYCGQAEWDQ